MGYALQVGLRYLRSKKRSTVSVITFIAVTGVALGVAALLTVLAITSGFQKEFRDKVLGVNAHVLVLKYGLDFDEYRDVIARAENMPEVAGAAPFLINEMMLAKDDRIGGVLVKGVDPARMPEVLDLPQQVVRGSLEGLRVPGAQPPLSPKQRSKRDGGNELDTLLRGLKDGGATKRAGADAGVPRRDGPREADAGAAADPSRAPEGTPGTPVGAGARAGDAGAVERARLPDVDVADPGEVEKALSDMGSGSLELPDTEWEASVVERQRRRDHGPERATKELPGVVVGKTLAENLELDTGDRVRIVSPLTGVDVSLWRPEARTPRTRDFRVVAVFEAGFQEYDSRLVYVDLYEAQRFYNNGDSVTGVEMRLHDLNKSRPVARRLERRLGGPFHTMDWAELNHNLFTALEIQKVMLSLVIASIIIVAAFNVVATLIMIVLEKKREIAILKAMGARDGSILRIFMVQGAVIGIVGTAIGLVLGGGVIAYLRAYQFPLDPKVYLIDHLPVVVSPGEFVVTAGVALGICLAATLLPSWWAARLLPADGVRYE